MKRTRLTIALALGTLVLVVLSCELFVSQKGPPAPAIPTHDEQVAAAEKIRAVFGAVEAVDGQALVAESEPAMVNMSPADRYFLTMVMRDFTRNQKVNFIQWQKARWQ